MPNAPLLHLLTEDIGAAQRLLQLIEDELQALEARDLERLQSLLDAKLPLLQQMENNGRQRSQLLQQAGVSSDRQGLAELAALGSVDADTLARSDELGELLERCKQANLRNGRVIRSNQHATGRLLDILRGQETPSLYDRRGSATQGNRQRPLSQA
ncbi:flagella synthesis protein FlgN [Pseudomonas sp. QL9]|uniref:flagella synthesis protein FlgN n=1 Tax=Pseudomonas sp. QL9 TaxID=3242725 RepID=UPI00352A7B1C